MHLVRNDRTGERYILGGTDDGGIAIWALECVRHLHYRSMAQFYIYQIPETPGAIYSIYRTSDACSAGATIQRKCRASTGIVTMCLRRWDHCCRIDRRFRNVGFN